MGKIGADNSITIMSPAAELGQGSMTSIPMIFAEELDADWNDVKIEYSPADDDIFKNPTSWVHGIMLTLGSSTVSGHYDSVRLYGAQARKILLMTAARHWNIPVKELRTEPEAVIHKRSSRRISYGEIATLTKASIFLPEITTSELKSPAEFRIIGSNVPRYDIPEKVTGKAKYSIDIDLPGMVYATVTHSPVNSESPIKVKNENEISGLKDILRVIILPDAVAIVAKTYEAAYLAEKLCDVDWSQTNKLGQYSDTEGMKVHLRLVRDTTAKGTPIQEKGDFNKSILDV